MEKQLLRLKPRAIYLFLCLMTFDLYAFIPSLYAGEEQPNQSILEMQLKQDSVLLFGSVDSVYKKKTEGEVFNLKGFQYYVVNLKVKQVWSKKSIKNLTQYYKIEFGTMLDEKYPNLLPVKLSEQLVVVLDDYKPNTVHILKDHLLSIYEDKVDNEDEEVHTYISKLTKNYNQKNIELTDLYRIAYMEQMRVYKEQDNKKFDTKVGRSIASTTEQSGSFVELPFSTIKPGSLKDPSRDPNSLVTKNKDEELSVFSLLLIFIFLGAFSHFIVKHYEKEEEL